MGHVSVISANFNAECLDVSSLMTEFQVFGYREIGLFALKIQLIL